MAEEPKGAEQGGALEFEHRHQFEAWLRDKPREVSIALSVRAALRVAPLVARAIPEKKSPESQQVFENLTSAIFRATASGRVAALYPSRPIEAGAAAVTAVAVTGVDAAVKAAAKAAAYAAHAAAQVAVNAAAFAAAEAVTNAAEADAYADGASSYAAAWKTLSRDAALLSQEDVTAVHYQNSAYRVAYSAPLWPDRSMPAWVRDNWLKLRSALVQEGDWFVWLEWYERRLKGTADSKKLELIYATVPQSEWDNGAAAANSWIKNELVRASREPRMEFPSSQELAAWLKEQPREASVVIAGRAALRLLPAAISDMHSPIYSRTLFDKLATDYFRAAFAAYFASELPVDNGEALDAANAIDAFTGGGNPIAAVFAFAARTAAERTPERSAAFAARTVFVSVNAFENIEPVVSAQAHRDALRSLNADVAYIGDYQTKALTVDDELNREQPLWGFGQPDWNKKYIINFERALAHLSDRWVLTDWYERRLQGLAEEVAIARIYAEVPGFAWEKGLSAVTRWISEQVAALPNDRGQAERTNEGRTIYSQGGWDFFLSYSKDDIDTARFVADTLRGAGFRVFAQFTDMPIGSDFLVEMNRGLADSGRLVAILSPRYVASKFCQAEWNAAYRVDPLGEERKIIPFLIEETDLKPLAASRVYKSLIGLSREQAAAAILESVRAALNAAPAGSAQSGADPEALAAIAKQTKDIFDLRIDARGQLAPKWQAANEAAGKDYGGFSVEDLYADALQAFADFADHALDDAAHNYMPRPVRDAATKLRNCAPPEIAKASPLSTERALAMALRSIERAERAGDLPKDDMVFHHQAELRGMYQRLVVIWPGLKPYREAARLDRFVEPDEKARAAQDSILQTTAEAEAASPELQDALRETMEALNEAEANIPPGANEDERRRALYDAMKSAAAQIVPIWNWAVNAASKLSKGSEASAKTLENLEKLAKRLANFSDYWDWFNKWWM